MNSNNSSFEESFQKKAEAAKREGLLTEEEIHEVRRTREFLDSDKDVVELLELRIWKKKREGEK